MTNKDDFSCSALRIELIEIVEYVQDCIIYDHNNNVVEFRGLQDLDDYFEEIKTKCRTYLGSSDTPRRLKKRK